MVLVAAFRRLGAGKWCLRYDVLHVAVRCDSFLRGGYKPGFPVALRQSKFGSALWTPVRARNNPARGYVNLGWSCFQ